MPSAAWANALTSRDCQAGRSESFEVGYVGDRNRCVIAQGDRCDNAVGECATATARFVEQPCRHHHMILIEVDAPTYEESSRRQVGAAQGAAEQLCLADRAHHSSFSRCYPDPYPLVFHWRRGWAADQQAGVKMDHRNDEPDRFPVDCRSSLTSCSHLAMSIRLERTDAWSSSSARNALSTRLGCRRHSRWMARRSASDFETPHCRANSSSPRAESMSREYVTLIFGMATPPVWPCHGYGSSGRVWS